MVITTCIELKIKLLQNFALQFNIQKKVIDNFFVNKEQKITNDLTLRYREQSSDYQRGGGRGAGGQNG